jgi:hypothetical protein
MLKGDRVTIRVGEYKVPMVYVGGGATVQAYSELGREDLVYSFIPEVIFMDGARATDMSKSALVDAHENDPANPYLPRVEAILPIYVEGPELNRLCDIYKMPFYRDVRQSDRKAWLDVKILHKLRADGMRQVYAEYEKETGSSPSLTFLGNAAAGRTVSLAKAKLKKKNPALVSALECLYESIIRYGRPGLTFEFNRRNIGVDRSGNLVLRDPVYDSEITTRLKKEKHSKEEVKNASKRYS